MRERGVRGIPGTVNNGQGTADLEGAADAGLRAGDGADQHRVLMPVRRRAEPD
ncbi:hypothetical protein ACOM2C_05460 [Pseudarthrobacter sp. So.54]